jgi:hypothetical protein
MILLYGKDYSSAAGGLPLSGVVASLHGVCTIAAAAMCYVILVQQVHHIDIRFGFVGPARSFDPRFLLLTRLSSRGLLSDHTWSICAWQRTQ